jgi:type II secretory pathway pseudopilin PulG
VKPTTRGLRGQTGASLIELVIVIAVFSATVAALLSGVSEAGKRTGENSQSFFAQQWIQRTIEEMLADRYNPNRGYAYLVDAMYPQVTIDGLTRTIAIPETLAGTAGHPAACDGVPGSVPALEACKRVLISVHHGSTLLAETSLVLGRR